MALLVASLFSPFTKGIWQTIDIWFFKTLNHTLDGNRPWQVFWALANHKLADWVEDLFFLGFFVVYVRGAPKGLRIKRVVHLVFIVLFIASILYFINGKLFREVLRIPRESPTLVVESSVKLSNEIDWLKIKDDSSKSFPGDHGTTALLFATSFVLLARGRMALLACFYGAFLCLPRLITGAHWLSDIVVGSGSIVLVCFSWAFCTPFACTCTWAIEKCFLSFKIWKEKWCSL